MASYEILTDAGGVDAHIEIVVERGGQRSRFMLAPSFPRLVERIVDVLEDVQPGDAITVDGTRVAGPVAALALFTMGLESRSPKAA